MSRSSGKRHALPWRYGLFIALFTLSLPFGHWVGWARGLMLGFDVAALAFMASLTPLFAHDSARIRDHVRENDANRTLILILSAIVSAVILVAVGIELDQRDSSHSLSLALVLVTLALAWTFSNIIYTLHYAYLFYAEALEGGEKPAAAHGRKARDRGGLDIPGEKEPDYWDFAYFAFTLGMTFQTSDIAVTARPIRKAVLAHSLAAFVFNLGIIAYTINILGS